MPAGVYERNDYHLDILAKARKAITRKPLSEETKTKIGNANRKQIHFNCEYCLKPSSDRPSHYKKKKRHFCSMQCYADYRRDYLPKEEQPAYGTGHSKEERAKRKKAREILNHALRDGKIYGPLPCEVCFNTHDIEAHHVDYDKPLEVRWLCFKHHREVHQNPELLEVAK